MNHFYISIGGGKGYNQLCGGNNLIYCLGNFDTNYISCRIFVILKKNMFRKKNLVKKIINVLEYSRIFSK
jgi:hypothetical protein